MISTCFNPTCFDKINALIPHSNLVKFATSLGNNTQELDFIICHLYNDLANIHKELGGSVNKDFQRISSIGVMARVALDGHKLNYRVCRIVDLTVMKFAYELNRFSKNYEVSICESNADYDYVLDFANGWVKHKRAS